MSTFLRCAALLALAAVLSACDAQPIRHAQKQPRIYYLPAEPKLGPLPKVTPSDTDGPPRPEEIPPNLAELPDPVPVDEPVSASGNAPTYEVYGKTYKVMNSAQGYHERGRASWYGRKFHGRKTATGEPYNMFALTGAHRALPIPSYVRVTNLENGKSCIVRVNDRGPFHSDRIIDLSYAAAVKLGMLGHGEVPVELEAITPALQQTALDARYLQVGAFQDPINAVSMRENLKEDGVDQVEIHTADDASAPWHRVLVGPFQDRDSMESARALLQAQQYTVTAVRD
ncbi:MAG TPA: septal ring lytic transglycosylase RlpA family protein [Nevskiaceae bacterium]|nr:septal ring lytic transglycosylase RlpA family protein [Nevskiaceae bacterium]